MASKGRMGEALGVAVFTLSSLAQAAPSTAQRETARSLMTAARQARKQGDLEGALRQFNAADAIMNVPTTGYEVAVTQADLGELLEARQTLLRVLGLPMKADDPQPFVRARQSAYALQEQLLTRIGSISFAARDATSKSPLEVAVDGKSVSPALLGTPQQVNPGKHVVRARADGCDLWREVDVGEGEAVQVSLSFCQAEESPHVAAAAAPAPPMARPVLPRKSPARAAPSRSIPPVAAVSGGLGLVGLGLGSFAGLSAIAHKNAAKRGCVNGSCPPSTWHELDTAHRMATLSNIGFAVGVIGVSVATGWILFDKPNRVEKGLWVSPTIGPRSARLSVQGRF